MTFDVSQLPGRAQELIDASPETMYVNGQPPPYTIKDQVAAAMAGMYDDFLDIPDPDAFAFPISQLQQAMTKIASNAYSSDNSNGATNAPLVAPNDHLAQVGTSGDYLENWTGSAAQAYKSEYADKFDPMTSTQWQAYHALVNALTAEAALWMTVRDDLDHLSADAIDKMKHVDDGICGSDGWTVALTVAGAVVAVASALPSGGSSIAAYGSALVTWKAASAAVNVAKAGISVAEAGGGDGTDEYGVKAGNAYAIVDSVAKALTQLRSHIKDQEQKIYDCVQGLSADLVQHRQKFSLPTPDLASLPHRNYGGDHNMGHPY